MSCYVALGDSFSAGTEPGVPSFTDRVAARLPRWRYLNLAVEGSRSGDVVERQLPYAVRAQPELVTVVCGANDVVRTTRPQIDGFAANFEHLLQRLGSTPRGGDRDLPRGRRAAAAAAPHPRAHDRRPAGRQRVIRDLSAVTARSASSWRGTRATATARTSPTTASTPRTPATAGPPRRWPRHRDRAPT